MISQQSQTTNQRSSMMKTKVLSLLLSLLVLITPAAFAQDILIPMDSRQSDHLKAYGIAFWSLERSIVVEWLLNYRGGSFLAAERRGDGLS